MLSLKESSLECIAFFFFLPYYCDFVWSIMTVSFVLWFKWFLVARRKASLYQIALLTLEALNSAVRR